MDSVRANIEYAFKNDMPVVIIYQGKDGISQRRVYIRSMEEHDLLAFCLEKKAVRRFKYENILSAAIGEEYG